MRLTGFRAFLLLLPAGLLLPHAAAVEPEAALIIRLYQSDSGAFVRRELPYSRNAGGSELEGSARVNVGASAEPADPVLLKLSVLSAARWGSDDDAIFEAGESFIKMENMAMTPLSISAGRQSLSWGRGLLFSDENRDHLFDTGAAVWDTLPHRLEMFYAAPAITVFDSPVHHLWLARWFYQADGRSSAEVFGGAMSLEDDGKAALAGLRGVYAPGPAWETWSELAGEAGDRNSETDLSALVADLGIALNFSKGRWQSSWTWASGSDGEEHSFVPLFNGEHWGRLYDPPLSGIHIFTVSGVLEITKALKLSAEGFGYWDAQNGDRLGRELDVSATFALSETLSVELGGCMFFTDEALRAMDDNTQSEIRFQASAAF